MVVVRGLGVKGGPGMGMASRVVFAIDGAGLGADVAVVTDGQLSGLVNKGLVIGEVTPEAAIGGPLALVADGDPIMIDVEARRADLDVPEAELARRRARSSRPPRPYGQRVALDLRAFGAAAVKGCGIGRSGPDAALRVVGPSVGERLPSERAHKEHCPAGAIYVIVAAEKKFTGELEMAKFGIGQGVKRVEDQRFLTGQGRYVDDIDLPQQAYGVTVLSPHAHARISSIEWSKAQGRPRRVLLC